MTNKTILIGIFVLISTVSLPSSSFADSSDEKLEFAEYLEETLGHFWAIEQNLDDDNAELALVHATHPIAELYSSMKPELKEVNPEFDTKVQKTLMDLGKKTGSDVSREDAQNALDDAKKIIEEAREIIVGDDLSNDVNFKAKLMQGLLKTSIGEYEESVKNGQIEMMAEFQDGSAFVWRSQQIFNQIKSDLSEHQAEEIEDLYSNLSNAYEKKADPEQVETFANGIINELSDAMSEETKDVDLLDYVENIRTLLDQVKEKYAHGDKDAALSLATKAYLDNFEFLEGPIAKTNPELVKELETMMREELRDMINNDATISDVNQQVDNILVKMDSVAKIVPEFGSIAAMILIAGIVSVIALMLKTNHLSIMSKI